MLRQKSRVWTIRELMKFAIGHLRRHGISEARLNVELLLSHALQCQRIDLYTSSDKPLTNQEMKAFRSLYERRLTREPVQYIVGAASFMGLQLAVDRRVFIPRAETETLIEQTMFVCNRFPVDQPISILEIGTGSGNIAVALAKFVRNAHVTTIDISAEALEVARQNARAYRVDGRITFERMDVFEPIDQLLLRRFDVAVSNPPYVAQAEWDNLQPEVRRFEPRLAVTDGRDGFTFHRQIVEVAPFVLRNGGTLLFEIGYGQSEKVIEMMRSAQFFDIFVIPDLQGIPRVTRGSCRSRSRKPGFVN